MGWSRVGPNIQKHTSWAKGPDHHINIHVLAGFGSTIILLLRRVVCNRRKANIINHYVRRINYTNIILIHIFDLERMVSRM